MCSYLNVTQSIVINQFFSSDLIEWIFDRVITYVDVLYIYKSIHTFHHKIFFFMSISFTLALKHTPPSFTNSYVSIAVHVIIVQNDLSIEA